MRQGRVAAGLVVALSLFGLSCGDDDESAMAGAPAPPPVLGERCIAACATSGTVCERDGVFAGICSTSCSGDASCQTIDPAVPDARCFGNRCALRCETSADCPPGTGCVSVQGRMACAPDGS
jgi:hypothetical protein